MVSKIHKELEKEIPLKELFRLPTIRELGGFISDVKESMYLSIEKAGQKEFYDVSSAQKRMYILDQFEGNGTTYNIPMCFELLGEFDIDRIESTFLKLIDRHESLRTRFEKHDGQVYQVIEKSSKFSLNVKVAEGVIEEIVKDFIRKFDLEKELLFRAEVVRISDKTYLLMDMHHAISDGISISILMKEFARIYKGESVKSINLQYKDFSEWESKYKETEAIKAQKEYWLKKFEMELPVLDLPYDYERPLVQSFEGSVVYARINKSTAESLKNLMSKTGSTLHMVMFSVLSILLSKYSRKSDVIIGTPASGRQHSDMSNIVGMFANTLAVRSYPSSEKRYIDYLYEVKENALEAYENQSYPFEELVDRLGLARDASRNPLFDVFLNVIDTFDVEDIVLDDLMMKRLPVRTGKSKLDISLNVKPVEKEYEIELEYSTKLFKKETVERMIGHLLKIISEIVDSDEKLIKNIEILDKCEKEKILNEFNKTDFHFPLEKTIYEVLEEKAKQSPNKIALEFMGKSMSYKEVNEKSNVIARKLRQRGVKANDIVAIMCDRSFEMILGLLGIMKSGGAYLPIDPEYPEDRKRFVLSDSKCEVLLTYGNVSVPKGTRCEVIDLGSADIWEGESSDLPSVNTSNDLAYVIYTSGSTGNPKGVLLEHKNLMNLLYSIVKVLEITPDDKFLLKTNYMFDVSISELFTWIICGGSVVIGKLGIEKNPLEISKCLSDNDITHINFVPSMLMAYIEYLKSTDYISNNKLKFLLSAGEELSSYLVEEFRALKINAKLANLYGPTEASVFSSIYIVDSDKTLGKIPIGKPLPNYKFFILSENNDVMPIGTIGELCISGKGVAREYLRREELTVEKFVKNPYSRNEIIYKTGDLARWISDGNVEFFGRMDNQTKVRGYRIELGEIENCLLKIRCVTDAAVIVDKNNNLVAFIALSEMISHQKIVNVLSSSIPSYMIPNQFVELKRLPKLNNGKIDRNSLKRLVKFEEGKNYSAPENDSQKKLAKIWYDLLKYKNICLDDNFFNLGGNSITVVMMISSIAKEFGIRLRVEDVYKFPTIRLLDQLICNKVDFEKFDSVNEILKDKYNAKISSIYIHDNKNIVLQALENVDDILVYLNNEFGIEYVPNYIVKGNRYSEYMSELDLMENVTGKQFLNEDRFFISKLIRNQIVNDNNKLNQLLDFDEIVTYGCGHGQNKILRKGYNDLIISDINFEVYCADNISKAFSAVIKNNSVLRTKIIKKESGYHFEDSSLSDIYKHTILDLTEYSFDSKKDITKLATEIVYDYVSKMEKVNNLLYRSLLIKLDHKNYKLVTVFSHLIFDGASNNIFTKQMYNTLSDIEEGKSEILIQEDNNFTYQDYLDEFKMNTFPNKFDIFRDSDRYRDIVSFSSQRNKVRNLKESIIKYRLVIDKVQCNDMTRIREGAALWLSLKIASIILEKSKVTFRITNNGRKIGGKNYDSLIGDCHVHYPLLLDVNYDDLESCISKLSNEYDYYYGDRKLYLEHMCYGDCSEKSEPNFIENMYDNLDFVFNYIGELSPEESNLYCENVISNSAKFKTYYIYAHSCDDSIIFNCRLPEDLKDEFLKKFNDLNIKCLVQNNS
ncbi:amino acid adenylation domain-containing protein [Bacillus pfraonensis]|uniref:non-ribosomal peptide synthetase n=1 Tax=Bacillus pfraonensis TaxID=2830844 RepID=UPI003D6F470D